MIENKVNTIEKVATGFKFAEGPLWHPKGYLLFSDCITNTIWRMEENGDLAVFLNNAGFSGCCCGNLSNIVGPNGLALDKEQNLIICQQGDHAIAQLDPQRKLTVLVNRYKDKPLNSPNDIAIRSDGIIYFTDPPYGLKEQVLNSSSFQPFGGVYKLVNNTLKLISTDFVYPNGLCFSPGERYLYVSSNHESEPALMRYELSEEGDIVHRSVLAEINADGITIDRPGNIYACTDEGIKIVSPRGNIIMTIPVPEVPSNITWEGTNEHRLWITARTSVYSLPAPLQ